MTSFAVGNLDPQVMDNCQLDSLGYELSGVTMGADTGSVSGLTFNEGVTTVTSRLLMRRVTATAVRLP